MESVLTVAQLSLTLCDLMDCNLPGSSAHGLLQARMLEGVAMPSSRRSSQPGDETRSPHCGQILRLLSHEASSDVEYTIYPLVQTFLYVTLLHTHVALIL